MRSEIGHSTFSSINVNASRSTGPIVQDDGFVIMSNFGGVHKSFGFGTNYSDNFPVFDTQRVNKGSATGNSFQDGGTNTFSASSNLTEAASVFSQADSSVGYTLTTGASTANFELIFPNGSGE